MAVNALRFEFIINQDTNDSVKQFVSSKKCPVKMSGLIMLANIRRKNVLSKFSSINDNLFCCKQ